MKNNKYLVTLTPINSFFFGNERTFGLGKNNEHYIIESECFPQQTSILGMLRKEILVMKNLIRDDWNYCKDQKCKIERLIGEKSFDINADKKQNFGVIEYISPVFIKKDKEYLMSIPKDHKKKDSNNNDNHIYIPFQFEYDKTFKVNLGGKDKTLHMLKDYVCKDGISNDFINKDGKKIEFKEIFKKDKQIGINLGKNKKISEDGLYKIIRYRLLEKCTFAFNVYINFSNNFNTNYLENYNNVVTLGGENSYFQINIKKTNDDIKDTFKKENILGKYNNKKERYKKIILLSNSYIDKRDYDEYCEYGIIEEVNFRNFRTRYENFKEKDYYCSKFDKSNKFTFLEKGSVLFSSETNYDKLMECLKSKKNIRNIGYNEYI